MTSIGGNASRRRGQVGWTAEGQRILSNNHRRPRQKCLVCRRPNKTAKGILRRVPYCRGQVYEDDFSPASFFKVEECGITRLEYDRARKELVSLPDHGAVEAHYKLSWEYREVTGCNDEFYNRYYRAWHITCRIVKRRDKICARCGADRGPYEFDHMVEIAAGGEPLDPANVQLLCIPCHRRKTAMFLGRGKSPSAPNSHRGPKLEAFA